MKTENRGMDFKDLDYPRYNGEIENCRLYLYDISEDYNIAGEATIDGDKNGLYVSLVIRETNGDCHGIGCDYTTRGSECSYAELRAVVSRIVERWEANGKQWTYYLNGVRRRSQSNDIPYYSL